ncbi:MAG: hypothetical protein EOP60_03035 [Sphingomonadales bacterium]|nr:MAG: hypothetical protein EOP60_03035 [Sphingomonadales bacterium]
MENDPVFQWTKMILDHLWLLVPLILLVYIICRPSVLRYISRVKFGDFELELASLKEELKETKQQLVESHSQVRDLIAKLDTNAPWKELRRAARPLKAQAGYLAGDSLTEALSGLEPGATPAALHAAAVIARKRSDPAVLGQLVACLDRLSAADDLQGVRLNTVWQLASAVHLTLVGIYKNGTTPIPDLSLLERARSVIERLIGHPRVIEDQPNDSKKGIQGPAAKALRWIGTALAAPPSEPQP